MDPDGPAMAPPEGQVPDFDNNGGSHWMGEAALMFCAPLAVLSVVFRVWSRLMMKPRLFGVEEGLLVCALGAFSGFVYIGYEISIFPGIFVHQWNMRLSDISNFNWGVHVSIISYCLTIMLLKVAILADWAHLFNPLKKRNVMFWAIRILLAANTICYIIGIFLEVFRCTPQRKIWDVFYKGGYCPIDINVLNLVTAVINVVSDVAILCLPQWVIWRLNMTRAARAGVSVLFLIGIIAVVCAFCRMIWLTKLLNAEDVTYLSPITGAFGLGEITAGFLIIGVPSAPKVFNTLFSRGSAVRSLWSKIRYPSWSGRRAPGGPGGGGGSSGRTPNQPTWRSPVHHKPRGAWEIGDHDTFDLLSMSTAHVEADRYPTHAVNFPQNSIKKDMRVDVINERID